MNQFFYGLLILLPLSTLVICQRFVSNGSLTTTTTTTTPITPNAKSPRDVVYNNNAIVLKANSVRKLDAINLNSTVKYVLFQVHSQRNNITLSYDKPAINGPDDSKLPDSERCIKGTDIGLTVILNETQTEAIVWLWNPYNFDVDVLTLVHLECGNAPVPGGCNMEFPVEISPFLRLKSNRIKSQVDFQLASFDYGRSKVHPSCDSSYFTIKYHGYMYFMDENDYSPAELFRSVRLMSSVSSMKEHATQVHDYQVNPRLRKMFLAYPGRGIVYNVIASYKTKDGPTYESAYVPIASYNCDLFSTVDGCDELTSVVGKVLIVVLSVTGLFLCLRGHQFFKTQMVFFGFIGASLPTFLLLARYATINGQVRDIATLSTGLVGGFLWLLVWKCLRSPTLSTLLGGIVLGFLITSTILFSTLGNEDILRSDLNYWMIVCCGTLILPLLVAPFGIVLSVVSCAIVGSYVSILAIDGFIGGSLSYIILNVVKRSLYEELYAAENDVPFQIKDILLSFTWGILAVLGMIWQFYSAADKPSFPMFPPVCTCGTSRSALRATRSGYTPIGSDRSDRSQGRRRRKSRRGNPNAPVNEGSPLIYPLPNV